jgi:hypothetical protein
MTDRTRVPWHQRWLVSGEFNVALFSFLLHFVWEFLQVPLFADMPTMEHWEAVVFCARAALGDVLIALFAFWVVALIRADRRWIVAPGRVAILGFIVVGVAITVALEWHATAILDRWQYGDLMPTVPILGTGVSPLMQWVLLPPLVVWIVRRQILGQESLGCESPEPDQSRARSRRSTSI